MFRRILAVLIARNREFLRDRSSLGWNIVFPVFIVAGFAFAFSGKPMDLYKVGVYAPAAENGAVKDGFLDLRYVKYVPVADLDLAVTKVERHQLDMLFDLAQQRYWVNDTSPRGYILEKVVHGTSASEFKRQAVTGREIRYVDWLLPGVLAMNMMFSSLFGVGYVIVRYRKNGVLKRLQATPLSAFEFLSAQVLSRLWLILAVTAFVFVATNLFIDFTVQGSYIDLIIVFAMGAFSMICLGLVVAARLASEELAGGLLNLITWPMMFLSGVWFSLEGANPLIQKLALLLPLTHVINAARSIMLDGAGLAAVSSELLILAAMSMGLLAIGALSFRWE